MTKSPHECQELVAHLSFQSLGWETATCSLHSPDPLSRSFYIFIGGSKENIFSDTVLPSLQVLVSPQTNHAQLLGKFLMSPDLRQGRVLTPEDTEAWSPGMRLPNADPTLVLLISES